MVQPPSPPASPSPLPSADLTTLLRAWREGSGTAFGNLIDQVYGELKAIAAKRLGVSGGAATLSPTELLHEALIGIMPSQMDFENRAHFFATMSLAIRSILVDHARARAADKRGGGELVRVTLSDLEIGEESQAIDLLTIEQALTQLEALDPRCGQIMHLTYFAGLEQDEIALLLNTSVSTVTRDLKFARGWITRVLENAI
jgi:RNA polymerase sigma factor (TIGR02999 family)